MSKLFILTGRGELAVHGKEMKVSKIQGLYPSWPIFFGSFSAKSGTFFTDFPEKKTGQLGYLSGKNR